MGKKSKDPFVYNAEIIKIVDGDTVDAWIDLGFSLKIKKRIRLMGIDTWESRTRDLEEKAKGLEAKAFTASFIDQGSGKFKIQSHGLGKYGRVLGSIWVDNKSLNEELIKHGHAYVYDGGKKQTFKKEKT